ncbi:MAG: carboxypeptidase-like regulatory domain-containing protein [Cytophagaceae bacterium]|nr:carboxypeptidase-like regulatory domain-containing protein [Cytophagaceae bacterium]
MNFRLILFFLLFSFTQSFAFYFKGKITDENNQALPFASIFVKNTKIGTNSNEKGEFSLSLQTGTYEVVFRYLGYETLTKAVNIETQDITFNIRMTPAVIQLSDAVVGTQKEDPALTIMRKTIAMSVFHYKELETYSFKSYLKGNMKILDIPFVFEKLAKKNFIEKNQLYVFESVHKVNFKQPGQLSENVIAKKDNLPPNLKNSVSISFGKYEIYSPDNEGSPVTKKGARNFKYEYLGYFEENGQVINKIKVTPKIKGYNSGVMNIVDGSWYIHSYDFKTSDDVSNTRTRAIFNAIDGVWFLSNLNIETTLESYGAEMEMRAVVALKDIAFKKNPKYAEVKPEIIDEKIFKEKATLKPKDAPVNKEATLKDLKTLAKSLENEDRKTGEAVDSDRNFKVDSMATKRDSTFWNLERQVPLTISEIVGFKKADSLYVINAEAIQKKIKKDSTRFSGGNKFKVPQLFLGHKYQFGKTIDTTTRLRETVFSVGKIFDDLRFNAVEGYTLGINRLEFSKNKNASENFKVGVKAYYSVQRNRLNGEVYFSKQINKSTYGISGGRRVFQINQQMPVSTFLNETYALLNGRHEAKLTEKSQITIFHRYTFSPRMILNNQLIGEQRSVPENQVFHVWLNPEKMFEPNNISHFNGNKLTEGNLSNRVFLKTSLQYSPNARLNRYNGIDRMEKQNAPSFRINHTFSFIKNVFGQIDLEVTHTQKIKSGYLTASFNSGFFYGNKPTNILDYKQFMGNELLISSHRNFRDLDYYKFSSDKFYVQGFLEYKPERLVLSQIPQIRKAGISEYVFGNFLKNQYVSHQEAGYGISLFGQKISAEFYTAYENQKLLSKGFRIILPLAGEK